MREKSMRLDVVVVFTQHTANMIADKANTEQAALRFPLVASKNSYRMDPSGCPESARGPANKLTSPAQKVTRITTTTQEKELTVVERSSDFGISVSGFSVSSAV